MENTVTIPITLPAPVFWGAITLLGISVASFLVFWSLPDIKKADGPLNDLKKRLGMAQVHAIPFLVGATLWAGIALALTVGLFGLIIDILGAMVPDRDNTPDVWEFRFKLVQLTALTTVLAAVVALPLTAIRLRLARQQTQTANEALFNDKINEATKGLYARRQVTEWHRQRGYVDHWQDDIVQRGAAIDRLEGLAREEPGEAPRIARLLSVYVRELSAEVPPVPTPKDTSPDELNEWARALPKLRSDMEKAAQTLGRLHEVALDPLDDDIDLRGANLQKADLSGLHFEKALLTGAQLQGAYLSRAQLQGAYLGGAQLQGADLGGAQLQGANLRRAQLQGAYLESAQFDAATFLSAAPLRGAALRKVDFTGIPQIIDYLEDTFGDASVILPNGIAPVSDNWPKGWAKENLGLIDFPKKWRKFQATLPPGWDAPEIDDQ